VQFDLRFYIVALVYLIFDVEVALFYPWAVAYGDADALGKTIGMSAYAVRQVALVDMLFFFGVLLVGFAYLWRFGYLDWVRSAATTSLKTTSPSPLPCTPSRAHSFYSPASAYAQSGYLAHLFHIYDRCIPHRRKTSSAE